MCQMAEPNNSVKVLEVCRVAPQSCSAETLEFLSDLTFFDLLWLRFPPIQRIFFYETSASSDSIVSKLKASLSITLQHFLPLAGALIWPQDSHKPIHKYRKGDAVSVTIAESDADFNRLISINEFVQAKKYQHLVPQLEVSHERASAMALQITIFQNRGFSIGISTHHAALDGKSSTMFFKLWAHICKHGDMLLSLKPFYGKMVVNDRARLESVMSNQFLNLNGPNNRSLMCTVFQNPVPLDSIRGTFEMTTARIEAVREFAAKKMDENQHHDYQSVHMSQYSITCAYTWVCLVKAEEIKCDKVVMIIGVDCRSRLDPPLPANYFGNCLTGQVVVAERAGLLGEDGFVVALNAISDAIKGLQKDVLLNGLENLVPNFYGGGQRQGNEDRVFSVAGSPRFKIYDTDFGWGKPRKIDVVSIERTGAISLSDSRNGDGGVEIGLVLRKPNMDAFASLFAEGLEDLL